MIKNITIGVLVLTTLLFGGMYFSAKSSVDLGRASGQPHYQIESFLQGLTGGARDQFSVTNSGILSQGGAVFSTTSSGAVAITASVLINNGTIMFTPSLSGATLTLPTKASLAAASSNFIPNGGDRTTRYIYNSTTTALALTTLAGNTGVILQLASTSATAAVTNGVSSMVGPATARLDFWRSPTSTDIYVQVQFFK